MSAILNLEEQESILSFIDYEIQNHPAWVGNISGLKAEKMLRGLRNRFILRQGEHQTDNQTDYYVTFILVDGQVKHQPFVITITSEGWCWENAHTGGPHLDKSIEDVLFKIMHCEEGQCQPYLYGKG